MIVGQSLPPIAPRTQGAETQQLLAEAERATLSFAELLIGAEPALATPGEEFTFASSGRDFRGSVNVGEDAIRFDARPVVAPVHQPAVDDLEHAAENGTQRALPGTNPAIDGPSAGAPVQVLHAASLAFPEFAPRQQGVQVAENAGAAGRERTGRSTAPVLAVSPAHRARASAAAALAVDGPRETTPAARAAAFAAQAKPPASVIVSPQDVLVVVHGIALSDGEQKTLLQDVRDLLAAHGLGGRAIRLRTDSRRTR